MNLLVTHYTQFKFKIKILIAKVITKSTCNFRYRLKILRRLVIKPVFGSFYLNNNDEGVNSK